MTRIPTRKAFVTRRDVDRAAFADKVSERLAFERIGAILYTAALEATRRYGKYDQLERKLAEIRRQERLHADLLAVVLRELGREPDDRTESARIVEQECAPMLDVCRRHADDPALLLRTLLTAEAIDNAGWELLLALGKEVDLDREWLGSFRTALKEEREHLHFIRDAVEAALREEVHPAPAPSW